ncbi:putative esterase [Algoriphagus boseongensis]|uniref:Putative esterase n=1 Tax=Algoriphagus boseongensis TaxID=1442587 RepID=A0A4R6T5W4_9BACT|nr:alpha/beta fold hydrolase [Algoriphagus boseongensis]TDQ17409.1 putative esterase [Algoriphagus boseongensis]
MKKSIHFSYEAHYSISHESSGNESEIWIVFHGYGQLSEFFIRKFLPFDSGDRLIIAPEGTNYGYLKEFQGRVGANWMTKHERETAISNNHRYLDRLMEEILSKFSNPPKIHVLGFSQGAATATRWASRFPKQIDTMVLWAGGFAHDLHMPESREKFAETRIILVSGDRDPFLSAEVIQKQNDILQSLGKQGEKLWFSGEHEINSELLGKIINLRI